MNDIQIIQDWCDTSISKLIENYDSLNRRASGNFANSLESRIEKNDYSYNVKILGIFYSYWMEQGRGKGKFPPISKIRQWIDDKGIIAEKISKDSLAFLIARKIAERGYVGKPLIFEVFTKQWADELITNVGFSVLGEIKSDILKSFKGFK